MDTTNNNVLCEEKDIIDIAEAIRSKTNDTNTMYVSEMANKIISIQGGEDVTEETNAYTDKITSLKSAITALETELQGKTSGGNGSVETCTVTITNPLPCTWTAFYNSLENNSIIGKSESLYYGSLAGTATITAIQGSVVVFIEAVNIGVGMEFGMENCSVSNEGIVLGSIRDAIELKTCAIAIQLPKTSTCTITFS